jgi:hypothetical protein
MKKSGIVAKIMATFKLGEEGKIGNFFGKLEKDFNREITAINHNLSALEFSYNRDIADLEEKLEDAIENVEAAWLNVTPEQVATNALQDAFKSKYLNDIRYAEDFVKDLQDRIKNVYDAYQKEKDELEEQIEKYKARIEKLNNF